MDAAIASMSLTTHLNPRRASRSQCVPPPRTKARIARSTSQLNLVPHTRCHVLGVFFAAGMRVAYLHSRRDGNTPSGRKQASGPEQQDCGSPQGGLTPPLWSCNRDLTTTTTTTTLLHKQASDQPR